MLVRLNVVETAFAVAAKAVVVANNQFFGADFIEQNLPDIFFRSQLRKTNA